VPGLRPNILVIWGDDIGITNLSCYSHGVMGYRTPRYRRVAVGPPWLGAVSPAVGDTKRQAGHRERRNHQHEPWSVDRDLIGQAQIRCGHKSGRQDGQNDRSNWAPPIPPLNWPTAYLETVSFFPPMRASYRHHNPDQRAAPAPHSAPGYPLPCFATARDRATQGDRVSFTRYAHMHKSGVVDDPIKIQGVGRNRRSRTWNSLVQAPKPQAGSSPGT
jgi:hypothetical protein